jgi:hypothetical protein
VAQVSPSLPLAASASTTEPDALDPKVDPPVAAGPWRVRLTLADGDGVVGRRQVARQVRPA